MGACVRNPPSPTLALPCPAGRLRSPTVASHLFHRASSLGPCETTRAGTDTRGDPRDLSAQGSVRGWTTSSSDPHPGHLAPTTPKVHRGRRVQTVGGPPPLRDRGDLSRNVLLRDPSVSAPPFRSTLLDQRSCSHPPYPGLPTFHDSLPLPLPHTRLLWLPPSPPPAHSAVVTAGTFVPWTLVPFAPVREKD